MEQLPADQVQQLQQDNARCGRGFLSVLWADECGGERMRNTIKTMALTAMIFATAILVKSVNVRPIWTEHPYATFCFLMISTLVWYVANMEE